MSVTQYKAIEEYLALPYTIEIVRDSAESYSGWFAKVVELPGCMTQADHFDDLNDMVTDAMRSWIEAAMEDKALVPEPRPHDEYSGKFIVRIPKSLHRELSHEAERDGVSLNTHIVAMLAKSVGKQPDSPPVTTPMPATAQKHRPQPSA